ncbi:MAG: C1 family peptidase, partial [Coriobacteriales bacterium]|nr:C1 family peptidase [Coriobacteriales bacterium]
MGFFCRRLPRFATLVLTVFLAFLVASVGLPGLAFAVDPAYLVDGIAADDELSPDDEFVSGYIPDTLPAPSIHDGEAGDELLRGTVDLPPSYDSRYKGLVTSPKNQGSFGTCWAFATMGVLESSLLSRGMVESTIDLSERHLAYFLYHTAPDPLGNTAGDSTVAINPQAVKPADGSDYPAYPVGYLVNGANATMACYTLTSWTGVARENAPGLGTYDELLSAYNDAGRVASDVFLDQVALDAGLSHSVNSFHLTQMRRIPLADADDVKQAIMDNGAVFLSLYYTRNYLNKNTGAYYYSGAGGKGSNHAVIAVGWDDDYSRDNFNSNSKPTSDGAWICKNSYGSDGEDSYFYVSYEDWLVAPRPSDDFNPVTFAMEAEPADALDNNYQYDGTVAACYNLIESGGSLASVFVAQANEGGYERLKAISLSLSSANVAYSVQVYVNPTDPSDPTSGTPSLAQPVEGTTDYAGYYTIDLGEGVALDEGDVFAVVVTLSCDEEFVKYNVDCTYGIKERYDTKNRGYYCIAHVEPGQSFERETVGADWDDLSLKLYDEYGDGIEDEPACCARIKAFTVNEEIEQVNDLANAQVEAIADQRYTGEELTPDVVVTYENRVLRKDRDYQV